MFSLSYSVGRNKCVNAGRRVPVKYVQVCYSTPPECITSLNFRAKLGSALLVVH